MKKILIFGIAVFILVAAGVLFYLKSSTEKEQINQTCGVEADFYCYYNNIPQGLKYINHEDILPKDELIPYENYSFYFDEDQNGKFLCKGTGKEAVEIKLFYYTYPEIGDEMKKSGYAGYGDDRTALICGNIYFINQYYDYGPELYGPFSFD